MVKTRQMERDTEDGTQEKEMITRLELNEAWTKKNEEFLPAIAAKFV